MFGASSSTKIAEKTIKLIHEQFPKLKITSVHVTHPHGDEIAALNVYVKQGIEILADEYTISAIKAYPLFSDDIDKFKFRRIQNTQVINGASFYVLESMHAKR